MFAINAWKKSLLSKKFPGRFFFSLMITYSSECRPASRANGFELQSIVMISGRSSGVTVKLFLRIYWSF